FINVAYVRLERWLFVLIFVCLFIILVWKLGQYRNQKMFNAMFPEVIQIMNAAATGGAGLLQSLERCGKDLTGQLGEEFKAIHKRLALGEDPMSVFEDSYSRYPYKEFYFFITIIRTNLSKGGQIREVITRLGRVIADSKKMEQKKKAMTSEARMSAFIVASFPIAFFLFMQFAMPENFDFLLNDPSGRYVLYYVFGSEAFGMLIIWWLMRKST
ncbi:TPA: type II secretion system F family protein, partial [Pasteurella multocida]|nr:type II secretion system F family protein [Pasteurella multocida]HDR1182824.1 type II secretion system F family protein [Pasteurella multocida]HDR1377608.1 type II secretion system F family protein [Pasteurella multocida]